MMKNFSKIVTLLLCLLFNLNIYAAPFPSDIDEIAQDIFSKITKMENVTANLRITETTVYTSTPDGQITLSRSALNKLYTTSSQENFHIYLSIIIAHEYAHQIQFLEYKNEMLQTSSCEMRTFYEADADIIAGYLFCRLNRYYETDIWNSKGNEMKSAMSFIYNLGDAEYSFGTHPSYKQRRNSFRMGVAFGIYKFCSDFSIKNRIGYTYNINAISDWSRWHEKMAKAICHNPNNAIINVLVEDVGEVLWNKTQNNPTVSFTQKFTNYNQDVVHLFIQYKVIGENRTDPDPLYADLTADIMYFEFDIAPKSYYTCSGTLNLQSVATSKYIPKLIKPPDNECMYFGTIITGNNNYDDNCPGIENYNLDSFEKNYNFSAAILKIDNNSIDNFQSLIFGFATSVTEAFTTHQSKLIFPQSKSNEISIYREDGSFNYDIGFTGSEIEMQTIFSSLKKCLVDLNMVHLELEEAFPLYFRYDGTRTNYGHDYDISLLGPYELIEISSNNERHIIEGIFRITDCEVELILNKDLKYSRYEVNLSFIKRSPE